MVKMRGDNSLVLTKREALDMLGIRGAALAELEGLARVRCTPKRVVYTAAETRRLIAALLTAFMRIRKVRAAKVKP